MTSDALNLARLGWQVFPAPVGTVKKSHIAGLRHGGTRWGATSDPDTLTRYWQQFPNANFGVACGPVSGIWCLDVDTTEGHTHDGHASLRQLVTTHGTLPHTVASVSPSGSVHFYFRWPADAGDIIRNSASRVAPGIDVRGDGGMVIAPPSVKPDGRAYQWQAGCDPWSVPVADAPDWLLSAARAASERPSMPAPPRDPNTTSHGEIRELLTYIDPDADGYDGWFSIVAAIHEATNGSDDGLALADEWSRRSKDYDPDELTDKYATGLRAGSGGYNVGTIAAAAGRGGADLRAIGQRHRIAAMANALGDYRPAGMTDAPVMPAPSAVPSNAPSDAPSTVPSNAPSAVPSNAPSSAPVDIVTQLVDILQPDPNGNLASIVPEAAQLSEADRARLLREIRGMGITGALREAIKIHQTERRRASTEAAGLIYDANGSPVPNLENVRRVLTSSDEFAGMFARSEFDGDIWVTENGTRRPMKDADTLVVTGRLQSGIFPSVSPVTVRDGITTASLDATFHPVREYLAGLRWDGVQRLHTLFTDYFPCQAHPEVPGHADYLAAAGQRFCIGAVARIFRPGCKVDTMPTLSGEQGMLKSTGIKTLVGEDWFGEDMPDMTEKDAKQWMRGRWVAEIAELASMKGKDVEHIKNFLSTPTDRYRPPFGRTPETIPRQTVFAGTVNGEEYLADATGGRRFWPMLVTSTVDIARLSSDRDQLWAEAVVLFEAGWRWWFDQGECPALEQVQDDVRIQDVDEARVADWLRYTQGEVTPRQIAEALFSNERGDRALSMRISRYLKALGWQHARKIDGQRWWERGKKAEPYKKPEPMGNIVPFSKLPEPVKNTDGVR